MPGTSGHMPNTYEIATIIEPTLTRGQWKPKMSGLNLDQSNPGM